MTDVTPNVTREEVRKWVAGCLVVNDMRVKVGSDDVGPYLRHILAALDDAERKEVQALKGELLDELAARGWMLMDLSCSTIVRAVAGDPRKPNREATGPNWRVRRNNGYYSYGETPDMAILAGLADEANEATPKAARAGGA